MPAGISFTNRTFRYVAQPRFPEGIDGKPPGPFSILNDPGINPQNGLNAGAPLPASVYQSVLGFDSFNPGTNFRAPTDPRNQNGVVFFPGSSGVYRNASGGRVIVGGFGVSGDGVDQDDVVTASEIASWAWCPEAWRLETLGHEPETRAALDLIFSDHFSRSEPGVFEPFRSTLLTGGDRYMHLADLTSYLDADRRLLDTFANPDELTRKAILNVAGSGKFSSDRTIAEYAAGIWRADPCPVP